MDVQTIKQLAIPVLKKHGIIRASLFGSAARGDMKDTSDIDILVELPNTVHGFDYVALKVDLQEDLESTLGKKVDVVEYNLIKTALKKYISPFPDTDNIGMQKDARIYLNDILFSISLIEQYTREVSFNDFEESYDAQDKVMRRLEIIAEAAKKLPEELRSKYKNIPWKSIIGLRNIITHNYDEVNLEEIWQIVAHHLPDTKKEIEKIQISLAGQ